MPGTIVSNDAALGAPRAITAATVEKNKMQASKADGGTGNDHA